jgi:glycosyltransferase involved in cell wall biosynthesis
MATYNRAHTLPRAIDSVRVQRFPDWELIVVDDGSTDNTQEVLRMYQDPRIRVVVHPHNRGVCAAKNTGFDHMTGEWFTTLDSDDEIVPEAISTMLSVPREVDPGINAVTVNCIDTSTGELSGKGLDHDQWLDYETLLARCSGEHWGLTRRSLLGDLRFNEKIHGGEAILWYKLSRDAKRYYVHKGLRLYHTEGQDRISQRFAPADISRRCVFYAELAKENEYLDELRRYRPAEYAAIMFNIVVVHVMEGRKREAAGAFRQGVSSWPLRRRMALRLVRLVGTRVTRGSANLLARRK